MEELLDFLLLRNPNSQYVVIGSLFLGASAGALGCFTVLRKRALIGDSIAHAVLPGVCVAFLFTGTKDPFVLLAGALVSGWIASVSMEYIAKRSRLSTDTSIALVLSISFGFGIFLLTMIQQSGMAGQSGLDKFLFGQAASMVPSDVWVFGIISLFVLLILYFLFKEFKLISFDPDFAYSIGIKSSRLEIILTTLLVASITVGIQAVGVVLMAALLITPAAAARFWTEDLKTMVFLAGGFGAASGWLGALVSSMFPAMPTGPWVVVAATFFFVISLVAAPKRGYLAKLRRHQGVRSRVNKENLLKALFGMEESLRKDPSDSFIFSESDILEQRHFPKQVLAAALRRLRSAGDVEKTQSGWRLTESGRINGRRITRLHRLWELYLTRAVNLPPDHVHAGAEAMEHVITPELEEKLKTVLAHPVYDPHQSPIPYEPETIKEA